MLCDRFSISTNIIMAIDFLMLALSAEFLGKNKITNDSAINVKNKPKCIIYRQLNLI